jgi:hypothetical protein
MLARVALVLLGSLLAGCSGGPPTGTPTIGPTPTTGSTTPPPTASPSATGALDALLPTSLGGQALTIRSASGAQVADLFTNGNAAELGATLEDINSSLDALELSLATSPSVGSADDQDILVAVLQIQDIHWTPYSAHLRRLVGSLLGPVPGHRLGTPIVAGRNPTSIVDPNNPDDQTYMYILREDPGDVVYFVNGAYPLVEELFSTLPEGG